MIIIATCRILDLGTAAALWPKAQVLHTTPSRFIIFFLFSPFFIFKEYFRYFGKISTWLIASTITPKLAFFFPKLRLLLNPTVPCTSEVVYTSNLITFYLCVLIYVYNFRIEAWRLLGSRSNIKGRFRKSCHRITKYCNVPIFAFFHLLFFCKRRISFSINQRLQ